MSLIEAIVELKKQEAMKAVNEMISDGKDALQIIEDCQRGMALVGEKFEKRDYFLSELMYSATMFESLMKIIENRFRETKKSGESPRVIIGTAKGDVHDIGKNIVVMVLKANGFDVIDLGVDVDPPVFVHKIKEIKPQIVGISMLITGAYEGLKQTCDGIKKEGFEHRPTIIIGGGPVTEKVREYSGADYYANDVMTGVRICKTIVAEGEKHGRTVKNTEGY